MEVADQTGSGIDIKGSAADDKGIGVIDSANGTAYHIIIETFLVQYDIRLNDAAAFAARNILGVEDKFSREEFMAFSAVIAENAAVELIDIFTAGSLMETVDILGNDSGQLTLFFQLSQFKVSGIWFSIEAEHFSAVEAIELRSITDEEGVAEDSFRRIVPLLMVETVNAAEVRDTAFGGHTGAAEEDDAFRAGNNIGKFRDLVHISHPLS